MLYCHHPEKKNFIMLIDSHCHINYKEFDKDRKEVLERAKKIGVERFILVNTHIREAQYLQQIAETYEEVFCTVGTHPCDAYTAHDLYDQIFRLCDHKKVVGIGETGVDYYYEQTNRKTQLESFETHIAVANELDLPVVVHTRDAEEDTLSLIKNAKQGVLHCFTGSYNMAKKALDLGFYISISGIVTFNNAIDLRQTIRALPLDRLLVETDAPYLTPEPYRKIKRNEPMYVYYTAKKIAEIKQIDFNLVCNQTTKNCLTLFSRIV